MNKSLEICRVTVLVLGSGVSTCDQLALIVCPDSLRNDGCFPPLEVDCWRGTLKTLKTRFFMALNLENQNSRSVGTLYLVHKLVFSLLILFIDITLVDNYLF